MRTSDEESACVGFVCDSIQHIPFILCFLVPQQC
jgi:hypothetical protein